MNKPYQRDKVEQRQDYEGEKQSMKQSEREIERDAQIREPQVSDEEE